MQTEKFLKTKEYKPASMQAFYCNRCDNHIVESVDESTGKFFVVFGHSYTQRTKEYEGAYMGVMFAICSGCLKEED